MKSLSKLDKALILWVPLGLATLLVGTKIAMSLAGAGVGSSDPDTPDIGNPDIAVTDTTLNNGVVVSSNGSTIYEIPMGEGPILNEAPYWVDEETINFYYGGSSSCPVNFTAMDDQGDRIVLDVRQGEGDNRPCTMDYRYSKFEITGLQDEVEILEIVNDSGESFEIYVDRVFIEDDGMRIIKD